jgi:hypothetical protein
MGDDVQHSLKKERFLEAFAKCGIITVAAEAAGCNRLTHYKWLKEDPEYPARFADAKEAAADRIDAEIVRRGVQGVEEPVFGTVYNDDGKPIKKDVVGHIRKYSDLLLIFRAKLLRPEYRERYEIEMKDTTDAEQRQRFLARRMASLDQLLAGPGSRAGDNGDDAGGNGRLGGNGRASPESPT